MINTKTEFTGKTRKSILNNIIKNYSEKFRTETYTLLSGNKGMGMSRYAQEIEKHINENIFIYLSFNVFHENIPLSGISRIVNKYFEILDKNPELKSQMANSIIRGLDKNNAQLIKLFPKLDEYLDIDKGPSSLSVLIKVLLMNLGQYSHHVIVFLDNFQYCDKSSIEAIDSIVGSKVPIHFIFTYQTGSEEKFEFLLEKMKNKNSILSHYVLEDFDIEDTGVLIQNILPGEIENLDNLIQDISRRINTTPKMIIESVKLLHDRNIIDINQSNITYSPVKMDSLILPKTIEDLLIFRLENLNSDEKEVLKYCAAIGRSFNSMLIENITFKNPDFFDYSYISQAIEKAVNLAIIEKIEGGNYTFTSLKVKNFLYKSIDAEDKANFHQICGGYFEEYFINDVNIVFELAFHFSSSNDLEKGVEYLKKAAKKALETNSYKEAINYCEKALDTVRYLNNEDLIAANRIEITFILIRAILFSGNSQKGITLLNNIKTIVKESKNKENMAKFYYWHGQMEYLLGNQIAAIQYFNQCIPIAEELGIKALLSTPYQVIGGAYFFKGEFYKAITELKKSLKYTDESEPYNMARCYGIIAWCYGGIGMKQKAEENIDKTQYYLKFLVEPQSIIATYHLVGSTYIWIGETKKGNNFEQRVIELSKKTDNHKMIYSGYYTLSLSKYNDKEYKEAIQLLSTTLDYSNKWNIKIGLHLIFETLADAYLDIGEYEKAIETADAGLKIVMQINNLYNAAEFHRILGKAHYLKHNPDHETAEKNLIQACEYADQLNYPSTKSKTFTEYTVFLYYSGNIEKAEKIEKKALQAFDKLTTSMIIEKYSAILNNAKQKIQITDKNLNIEDKITDDANEKVTGVTIRHQAIQNAENKQAVHLLPRREIKPIPEGIYTLSPIINEILHITGAKNNEEVIKVLFEYILSYSGFEAGYLFALINGKMECLGGVNVNSGEINSKKICKQAMRDAVLGKKAVYVKDASEHNVYKLNPHVYSRGIKSVYSSYADTGKIKSIIYLETVNEIIEIDNKLKELIKHYQNISISMLVK